MNVLCVLEIKQLVWLVLFCYENIVEQMFPGLFILTLYNFLYLYYFLILSLLEMVFQTRDSVQTNNTYLSKQITHV